MSHLLYSKYGFYKCNACGAIEKIATNGDCDICLECGSPEDYTLIEE